MLSFSSARKAEAAEHEAGSQGGNKVVEVETGDDPAVKKATGGAHHQRSQHDKGHWNAHTGQSTGNNACEADDSTGGQVNPASYEDKRNTNADDAGICGNAKDFLNISEFHESRRSSSEDYSQNSDKAEGNNLTNKLLTYFQGFHSLDVYSLREKWRPWRQGLHFLCIQLLIL